MLLLIPLLAIGALAILATRHQVASASQLAAVRASGAPSPIAVLDHCLRVGQTPPTFVVACAIAEAEALHRTDLRDAIVDAFVRPIVAQAEAAAEAMRVHAARDANFYVPWGSSPMPWDASAPPPASPAPEAMPASAYRAPMGPMGGKRKPGHGVPGGGQAWFPSTAPEAGPGSMGPTPGGLPSIADPSYTRVEIVERSDRHDPSARAARGAGPTPNEGTITVSGNNSPIADVSNEAWGTFASRVARELPTFSAARHVGQFRQRRERLTELGFDPDAVASSPELQRAAFNADMANAYLHASESGLLAEYRGSVMEIPAPESGQALPIEVTVSGVMGVIQAAGLEGAVAWLERPEDRRRFPHTTAAFLRSNGAF